MAMAERERETIIVKKSGGAMTAIIAVLLLALVGMGAYALMSSEQRKDDAIGTAAQQVGDAAQDIGDAAQDAAKKVN